jgi:hypothetical protein
MSDQLHASTPFTKWTNVDLDTVAKGYILPHLGIESLLSSQKLIIMLTDIFQ